LIESARFVEERNDEIVSVRSWIIWPLAILDFNRWNLSEKEVDENQKIHLFFNKCKCKWSKM
jgi:hypothetical protein